MGIVGEHDLAIHGTLHVYLDHVRTERRGPAQPQQRVIRRVSRRTAMADAQEAVFGGRDLNSQPVQDRVDTTRHPGAQAGPGDEHLRRDGDDLGEVPRWLKTVLR